LPQEIHDDFSNGIKIFRSVTGTSSAGVFFEGDIKASVQFVGIGALRTRKAADDTMRLDFY